MSLYVYEAKSINGNILKGRMEATDANAVSFSLREKNYYPTLIKPFKKSFNIDLSEMKKVSLKDISIFCKQFSVIISSGITIVKAVEIVREQTENPKFKKILTIVNEEIQKGKSFSMSLKQHKDIPDMLINLVEVGEVSGTLDKMLATLSVFYDKEYKQHQKIQAATTYPKIIAGFAAIVVIGLVVFIVPTLTATLLEGGVEIPAPTKMLMAMSKFLVNYGVYAFIALVIVGIMLKVSADKTKGELKDDSFKMKIPVFGKLYVKIVTSRFARTFGILMSSGVPILQSLDICASVLGSKVFGTCLGDVKETIKKGGSLGTTLIEKNIFPPMLTQMIKIGEESGNLDGVLEKTAQFYDDEVELASAQMTAMMEPLIIIVLAVIVGFIVLSIALPMFAMNDTV